ncbi:hypothetical protein FOS14_09010 [Skermania sp. ID1734]|uniref:hypothetical protein n=1 Tax=Skermania sp. ID1734 TaxID=2597516 RepID=UPI00117EA8F8|nr:hypothetical protein [Skermania sp. ID1734]TSD99962.1 hypothetical protein FOS14_09010 [Skermania sp. ID1734]
MNRTTIKKSDAIAPEVARLAAEGHSRNSIARRLEVSPGTVSRAAATAGVSFDGSMTAAATEVRKLTNDEKRAHLETRFLALASDALDHLDFTNPSAARNLATVAAIFVDKATAVVAPLERPNTSQQAAESMLDRLVAGLEASVAAEDAAGQQLWP